MAVGRSVPVAEAISGEMAELELNVPRQPDSQPRRPRYGCESRRGLYPKRVGACELYSFAFDAEGTDLLRRELLLRHSERGVGREKGGREVSMSPSVCFYNLSGRWSTFPSGFIG